MRNENDDVIYFNNAAMARLDMDVRDAGIHAILNQFDHDASMTTSIRRDFASLIGADDPNCIAFMPSTAYAISFAANNLSSIYSSGKVLVLQDQMCSAVYPWQEICDRSNGNLALDIVPYPKDGASWTEMVLSRLIHDPNIIVACLPPLHWSDGSLIDLVSIGAVCFERDIPLIVDATQAIGALPFNVTQIRPMLVACSVHKWLRAPSGVCLVYIDPKLHETWTPLDQNGRGRNFDNSDWDSAKYMMGPMGYPTTFFPDARKFDSGGKPNPILLPMLQESLKKVLSIDQSELQQTLKRLVQPLLDWIRLSGTFCVPDNHAYHIVGIRPLNDDAKSTQQIIDIYNRLQTDWNIFCAVRCGALRISTYNDNTNDDIQALIGALKEITRLSHPSKIEN